MGKSKLFQRDFTMVVIGQIISLFGNAVLRFVLPLFLLRETGSSALYGMVSACSFLPMVVFSLFGGVIADRVNKRNIMVILDFGTAVLTAVFYLFLGKLPLVPLMIVALMILYGIQGAYQPAVQASIPLLVGGRREGMPEKQEGDSRLIQGNAVINMVNTLSGLIGPVLGGVLFGSLGIYPVLVLCVFCFGASAVMEIFIHIPQEKRQRGKGMAAVVAGDLRESWHFIREEKPVFLSVMGIIALFNLVLSAALVVGIPVMVVNLLGMSDAELGITQGGMGLGGLLGGMAAGAVAPRVKLRDAWLFLAGCALTAFLMGVGLLPGVPGRAGYWLITGMGCLAMAVSTIFTVLLLTLVQEQTPDHLLGKIMALSTAISACSHPVGQAAYGLLFDGLRDRAWGILFGAAAVAVLISLYSRRVFAKIQ